MQRLWFDELLHWSRWLSPHHSRLADTVWQWLVQASRIREVASISDFFLLFHDFLVLLLPDLVEFLRLELHHIVVELVKGPHCSKVIDFGIESATLCFSQHLLLLSLFSSFLVLLLSSHESLVRAIVKLLSDSRARWSRAGQADTLVVNVTWLDLFAEIELVIALERHVSLAQERMLHRGVVINDLWVVQAVELVGSVGFGRGNLHVFNSRFLSERLVVWVLVDQPISLSGLHHGSFSRLCGATSGDNMHLNSCFMYIIDVEFWKSVAYLQSPWNYSLLFLRQLQWLFHWGCTRWGHPVPAHQRW